MKPDHAVGRAFAQAVFARRSLTARAALTDAIKVFPESEVRAFGPEERFPDAVTACVQGISATLDRLGILPQEIDRVSDVISEMSQRELTELLASVHSPDGVLKPSGHNSYLARSILYFAKLLESFDLVLPVISIRQAVHVKSAIHWALKMHGSGGRAISPVFFGEVLVDSRADSISFRRFHSVDSAMQEVQESLRVQAPIAAELIKLVLLLHPVSKPFRFQTPISAYIRQALGKPLLQALAGRPSRRALSYGMPVPGSIPMILDAVDAPKQLVMSHEPRVAAISFLNLIRVGESFPAHASVDIKNLALEGLKATADVLGLPHMANCLRRQLWNF
ncbi:hypothetical protein [Streptomyces sp. NPDC057403]|uniref:hypothetical protein n=1 Tax=Streptomyces sp. NPDC057403 TaxID=3346119 RepID=UPI0036AC1580